MASFEGNANGTRQHVVYNLSHPGFFNPMPTLPNAITYSGQTSLHDVAAPDPAMYNGQYGSHYFGGGALEHFEPLQSSMWPSYSEHCLPGDRLDLAYPNNEPNWGDISGSVLAETLFGDGLGDDLYDMGLETERFDDGHSPPSTYSFHSVQVSDTTFTSGPTTTSSPECMLERSCCTSEVADKQINKEKINRKRKRRVETTNHCEIRISTKIPKDGRYKKGKAWLGTFATPAQAGRALDVGKYFLCAKKKKVFYDPNSEAMLSAFKDQLHALPLTELVENVTKMAKHYGENGSFVGYQGIEAIQSIPGAFGIPEALHHLCSMK